MWTIPSFFHVYDRDNIDTFLNLFSFDAHFNCIQSVSFPLYAIILLHISAVHDYFGMHFHGIWDFRYASYMHSLWMFEKLYQI